MSSNQANQREYSSTSATRAVTDFVLNRLPNRRGQFRAYSNQFRLVDKLTEARVAS
jgi:hypothetical protein